MKRTFDILVIVATLLMLLAVLTFLGGCSATRQLAGGLSDIDQKAKGIESDCREAVEAHEAGGDPRPPIQRAAGRARDIQETVAKGQKALAGVEDKTPAWLTWLTWTAAAAVVLVVAYVAGGPVRNLLARLFPPKQVQASAALDAKVLAGQSTPQEAIAARRASDPVYEAAYQRAKEAQKGREK